MSSSKSWIPYALLATACFAVITILFRVLSETGAPASASVGIMFGLSALGVLPFYLPARKRSSRAGIYAAVLIGVLAYFGNIIQFWSIAEAPNPGLTTSVIGGQVLVVALVSVKLLGASLSPEKFAGILLVTAGIVCIAL